GSGARAGFMPFKRQYGYIWTGSTGDLPRTIAHELAHGAFRLRHTFSPEAFIATQGSTDNLMDYSSSGAGSSGATHLYKHQWDNVHNPEGVTSWLQDDEEGAYYDPTYSDIWAANLLGMMCAKSMGQNEVEIKVDYAVSTSEVTYGKRGGVRFEINDIQIDIKVDELPSQGSYTVDIGSKQTSTSGGKTLFSYTLSETGNKLSFIVDETSSPSLSTWLTSPPQSLFQALVDNVSSTEGNAAYSALTRLPQCAYELITAASRVQYIDWMVNGEWMTNEHQEELIIRLLEEVPYHQVAELVMGLEGYGDWEGLFESFDNISTHQGLFRSIMKLYQSSTTEEEQKEIKAVFDFNMLNHTSASLDYISVAEVSYEAGQLDFTRAISTASWTPYGLQNIQQSSTLHARVGLFDPVLVIVNDDHENLGLQLGTELKSLPAILAAFFIEKKNSETNKHLASTGLDIALLAVGVGEVSAAIKAYQTARTVRTLFRLTLAVSDFAVSFTDLACQSDDSELCNEWREVSFYIQIGLLTVNAADGLESLMRRTNSFSNLGKTLTFKPTWIPNRTIVGDLENPKGLIGVYRKSLPDGTLVDDTQRALADLDFPETYASDFTTASKDGYKMLNTNEWYYRMDEPAFWDDFNKPWLDKLTGDKADIVVLSDPNNDLLKYQLNPDFSFKTINGQRLKSGFGKEIDYMEDLVNKGAYEWDSVNGVYKYVGD
ncbi:MAG: hypothetical protein RIC30_08710, partial [Marinoscillum sp.]